MADRLPRPKCCAELDKENLLATPSQIRVLMEYMHRCDPKHEGFEWWAHLTKEEAAYQILRYKDILKVREIERNELHYGI